MNMPTLQQPEMYIGGADKLFDSDGDFINPATRELCRKFLETFAGWIERQLGPR